VVDIAFLKPVESEIAQVETRIKQTGERDFPYLTDLLGHVLGKSGKRMRPGITLLVGKNFTYFEERHVPMAAAVELLHLATLVHDDIVDDADTRRGEETINALWGSKVAVLLGDYLFANSAELVTSTGSLAATELFAHTLRELATGELQELSVAFTGDSSRDLYWKRIYGKTASLFATAAESAAILGDASPRQIEACRDFGTNLGMAFQIVDDILDFEGSEEQIGKPVGNDLLQGVLTLPVIIFIEQHGIQEIIKSEKDLREPGSAAEITEKIQNSSAIADAYTVADEFLEKARHSLKELGESTYQRSLVEMIGYVTKRQS
tara:strand:+ start:218 stop:1180 length:963 start_codon:yes stop_codon:yes gene_type:complete